MTDTSELTVTQTMHRLGKANRTIHNMIADGRLTGRVAPGPIKYFLITVESIEAYEAQQQKKERNQSGN